jgi:serine/threonine protein phosphatase PrpC
MISFSGVSDGGPVRDINEDAFCADGDLSLFIVADGMGGHAAGEVASRLVVDAIHKFIGRSHVSEECSWPCGIDPDLTFNGNRVRTAIHLANRRVFRAAESNDDYTGMGSTVVCALIRDASLTIGHVGDSRLYVLSGGVLTSQTRDDTWAATVLSDGDSEPDPQALAAHPMRHVLTNVLGVREQAEIHMAERTLADGATILLCTDGVHGAVDEEILTSLLASNDSVDTIARSVVDAALSGGTRDNVTALVVRYRAA